MRREPSFLYTSESRDSIGALLSHVVSQSYVKMCLRSSLQTVFNTLKQGQSVPHTRQNNRNQKLSRDSKSRVRRHSSDECF